MSILNSFDKIKQEIEKNSTSKKTQIIAISKTFPLDHVKPLVDYGHDHFGENKVQEAEQKWGQLIKAKPDLNLHMVGRLQSNKAKKAVEIFNYIHSLDSEKLAKELAKREKQINKKLKYFIQVNLGSESQKGGIEINNLKNFYNFCVQKTSLSIVGLMAIPPNDNQPDKYFEQISDLNNELGLTQLSIGMSNDYKRALKYNSSFIRIGSAIFGKRN